VNLPETHSPGAGGKTEEQSLSGDPAWIAPARPSGPTRRDHDPVARKSAGHGRLLPGLLTGIAAGVAAGLLLTWLHHPQVGMYVVAAALAAAALLRLTLSERRAGLLVVRSRWLDVLALTALAVAIAAVAAATPFPTGS
jgi:hypothetical protein